MQWGPYGDEGTKTMANIVLVGARDADASRARYVSFKIFFPHLNDYLLLTVGNENDDENDEQPHHYHHDQVKPHFSSFRSKFSSFLFIYFTNYIFYGHCAATTTSGRSFYDMTTCHDNLKDEGL